MPFWLHAGRSGRVDRVGTNLLAGIRAEVPFASEERGVDYSLGVDLTARRSNRSTVHFRELYGRLGYGLFQLTGGRKQYVVGIIDTTLSSGSMMWGANAVPVPRVSISTTRYIDIPGTDGFLSARGYLAHGWFERHRYIERPFLHQKYGYIRLLPRRYPVQLHAGVIHSAMWGGVHPKWGRLHTSFENIAKMVLGYRPDKPSSRAIDLGNVVAAYDFGVTYRLEGFRGVIYRQFYIEDKPALLLRSPWDGMWGISLRRPSSSGLVSGVLWEYINTLRQGAKYIEGEVGGADNYYNHTRYRSGWTYHGRTIGSPLMFADEVHMGVSNNRLVGHHLALMGTLPQQIGYRLYLTYSRNYGASRVHDLANPERSISARTARRDQYSYLLELSKTFLQRYPIDITLAVAVDKGEVHPDNIGMMIGCALKNRVGSRTTR